MDIKDRLLHEHCPTVMVTKYSPLPDLESGKYRYLMASDGLWVEAMQPWGFFRQILWESPKLLPYGEVGPVLCLAGDIIPSGLFDLCIANALYKAKEGKEWAGWITYSLETGLYTYLPLQVIHESKCRVEYRYPELCENEYLVLDLHSHPFDMPTFSSTDDEDNKGGVRLAGVISFDKAMLPTLTVRLCVEGHFFEMEEEMYR